MAFEHKVNLGHSPVKRAKENDVLQRNVNDNFPFFQVNHLFATVVHPGTTAPLMKMTLTNVRWIKCFADKRAPAETLTGASNVIVRPVITDFIAIRWVSS